MIRSYQYIAIWTKIKDSNNIKLNALRDIKIRYMKTKIKTYDDKVYTNFLDSNVPEDDIEYESFIVIYINYLLVYDKKYYL